jgi:hypothetical protein
MTNGERIGLQAVLLDEEYQAGLKRYLAGIDAMSDAGSEMQAGAKQISQALGMVDDSVDTTSKSNLELAASVELVEKAYDQARQLLEGGLGLAELGAQAQRVEQRFTALAGGAEQATKFIIAFQEGAGGTASRMTAMASSSRLLQMGLVSTTEQMQMVVEMATRLGDQTQSVSDRVSDFSALLANQSTPRLDNFGIASGEVRARVEELTTGVNAMSRDMAFMQAVMESGGETLEILGERVDDNAAKMERAKARVEDLKVEWGQKLAGAAGTLADAMSSLSDETLTLIAVMTGGIGIATKFAGGMGNLLTKMNLTGVEALALTASIAALIGVYEAATALGEEFVEGQATAVGTMGEWADKTKIAVESGMSLAEAAGEMASKVNQANEVLHANGNVLEDVATALVRAKSETELMGQAALDAGIAIALNATSVDEARTAIDIYNESLENNQARIELTDENLAAAIANNERREALEAATAAQSEALLIHVAEKKALVAAAQAREAAKEILEAHTIAVLEQAEALGDASAAQAAEAAIAGLTAQFEAGAIPLDVYTNLVEGLQVQYDLVNDEGRALAEGISELNQQLANGDITLAEYNAEMIALIDTQTGSIQAAKDQIQMEKELADAREKFGERAIKAEQEALEDLQKEREKAAKEAEELEEKAASNLEKLREKERNKRRRAREAARKERQREREREQQEEQRELERAQKEAERERERAEKEAERAAEKIRRDVEREMEAAAKAAEELPGRLFDALSGLGSIAIKTLQDELEPLDEELGEIDSALELWKKALEDPTADLDDQQTALERIGELEAERARIAKERAEQEARIAEFQAAQQQMALLQQQLDLMELVQEHGLNAQEILGGLTADASASEIVDATTAAMQQIIEQTQAGLNFGTSATTMTQAPAFAPPTMAGGNMSSTQNTFDFGGNSINTGMDAAQFEAMIRRVLAEAVNG